MAESGLKTVMRGIETMFPEVWRKVYTRHYDAPGYFASSKVPAAALATGVLEARYRHTETTRTALNVAVCASVLQPYNYPTFYVGRELAPALLNTKPPEALTWDQINMPFPGMIFMLPKGFLVDPQDGDVPFLGVVKVEKDKLYEFPLEGMPIAGQSSEDKYTVFWACDAPDKISLNDNTFPSNTPLQQNPESIEKDVAVYRADDLGNPLNLNLTTSDFEFSALAAGLVARFIMVMQARPQLVETAQRIGRKRLKHGTDLWTPNFIGRNYRIERRHTGAGEGGHVRLHWRQGHVRHQHYGPGNNQLKVIWIAPYVAGLIE